MRIAIFIYVRNIRNIRKNKKGQTLVEYGLIVAFVSLVVILLLQFLGEGIVGFFSLVTDTLGSKAN
jgi:Flp pilus assembly pilin Flp